MNGSPLAAVDFLAEGQDPRCLVQLWKTMIRTDSGLRRAHSLLRGNQAVAQRPSKLIDEVPRRNRKELTQILENISKIWFSRMLAAFFAGRKMP